MSDRRREADGQIGYLTARMEEIEATLKEFKEKDERRWARIETHMQKMQVRVGVLQAMLAIAKAIGTAILLALTFKFGDIPKEFASFFDFSK